MQTIVIIDDNQVVGSIYRSKLRAEGFIADVAASGEAGLDMVRRLSPDLVLLDLMLPQISGVDVLKAIRGDVQLRATPVIVFSNSYDDSLVQEAWSAGATQVLSKATHNPKQVVAAVNAALAAKPAAASAVSPPSASAAALVAETAAQRAIPVHAKILYLSEQRDTRLLLTVLLEAAGHRVTTVNSSSDAVAMAQSMAFDLFLIRDPETDSSALALSRQLRALRPVTPVALFSIGANPSRREEALRTGASTFISDPHDVLGIAGIVSKLIRQAA